MNIVEMGYEILIISQFTLQGVMKGNKPDFHQAMKYQEAETYFNKLVDELKGQYEPKKIQTGVFGAQMVVDIKNQGPATLVIDI